MRFQTMVHLVVVLLFICLNIVQINTQYGPDPWHYASKLPEINNDHNIPPDIRMPLKRKSQSENKLGIGEWFFKRTLAIVLRGGNTKINEDGSVDVSLQMKFYQKHWEILDEVLKSNEPLSEDMLRRSVGYVEESIYKPTIAERIVLTWSEYVQVYLAEYKFYITWSLGFIGVAGGVLWLWSHMSHKHAIVVLLIIFYAYEVVISYKEAEQKELEKFISAVDKCKWYFWSSNCDVPPPDPLVFMKHMNPMKIGIRMITTAFAEPFVVISGTLEIILQSVTAGLWYPFDKIMFGILVVIINLSLIFLLVMIIFNWVLNIPFSLKLFGVGVSVKSKNSTHHITTERQQRIEQPDAISQATLDKILNVCSLALSNKTPDKQSKQIQDTVLTPSANVPKIRRSASTGRLPNNSSFEVEKYALENSARRRNVNPHGGSGDA